MHKFPSLCGNARILDDLRPPYVYLNLKNNSRKFLMVKEKPDKSRGDVQQEYRIRTDPSTPVPPAS